LCCREEGAADGGIVVQDCLQLTHSLLRNNPSNQRMFRWAARTRHNPCFQLHTFIINIPSGDGAGPADGSQKLQRFELTN